jgi:hypothetical protein
MFKASLGDNFRHAWLIFILALPSAASSAITLTACGARNADAGHLVGIYLDIAHLHLFISIDDEQSEFLAIFYPWRARPMAMILWYFIRK